MEERKLSVYRGSKKDYVPVHKITIQKRKTEYDSEGIRMVAEPAAKFR